MKTIFIKKINFATFAIMFSILCISSAFQLPFDSEQKKLDQDSLPPAIIDIIPNLLEFPYPEDGFITANVKVLNRGGSPLYINRIETSCKCASGTTQQNPVYPMEIGKIYLQLNVHNMNDSSNIAEYVVYSNAENSPINIRIKLNKKIDGK